MIDPGNPNPPRVFQHRRVLVLGATGTIGRATTEELVRRGHEVVCLVRPRAAESGANSPEGRAGLHEGAEVRFGEVTDPRSLECDGIRGEQFDVLVSCLASRNGAPKDAWAIDYRANINAMAAARHAGVSHIVLLSAICVQKPLLAFQHAKLAFERALIDSGLTYSIVRPTAFFKSLSGQIDRVRGGKPYLVFGDGRMTACKPISDRDLALYLADCLDDADRINRILPIGGPGDAITPRQQGEHLFELLGRKPQFKQIPVRVLDAAAWGLGVVGRVVPPLADKAELARIGRYYATESMLVWDPESARYDAAATPSAGSDTLFDYYERLLSGEESAERGEHAVF